MKIFFCPLKFVKKLNQPKKKRKFQRKTKNKTNKQDKYHKLIKQNSNAKKTLNLSLIFLF